MMASPPVSSSRVATNPPTPSPTLRFTPFGISQIQQASTLSQNTENPSQSTYFSCFAPITNLISYLIAFMEDLLTGRLFFGTSSPLPPQNSETPNSQTQPPIVPENTPLLQSDEMPQISEYLRKLREEGALKTCMYAKIRSFLIDPARAAHFKWDYPIKIAYAVILQPLGPDRKEAAKTLVQCHLFNAKIEQAAPPSASGAPNAPVPIPLVDAFAQKLEADLKEISKVIHRPTFEINQAYQVKIELLSIQKTSDGFDTHHQIVTFAQHKIFAANGSFIPEHSALQEEENMSQDLDRLYNDLTDKYSVSQSYRGVSAGELESHLSTCLADSCLKKARGMKQNLDADGNLYQEPIALKSSQNRPEAQSLKIGN